MPHQAPQPATPLALTTKRDAAFPGHVAARPPACQHGRTAGIDGGTVGGPARAADTRAPGGWVRWGTQITATPPDMTYRR